MKKIFKIKGLIVALLLVASCGSDDDSNSVSTVPYSKVDITVSSDENNVIVMENAIAGSQSYTITATIDEPQELHYVINLMQTDGNATENVDFDFDHQIIISPGDTSGIAHVNVYPTGDIEEDEYFTISASLENNYANLANSFNFSGTITDDYVDPSLELTMSWDGSATSGDVSIESFCGIDFDLLLYDANFGQLGYVLGTADCPEHDYLPALADGTYYLVADLYENPFKDLGFTDTIPLVLDYNQEYFDNSGSLPNSSYNLSSVGSAEGGTTTLAGIAQVIIANNGMDITVNPF